MVKRNEPKVYDDLISAALRELLERRSRQPKLPKLTDQQRSILDARTRFKVIRAGRRWGKSTLALVALVEAASRTPSGVYAWVFPVFAQGEKIGWRLLREACPTWIFNETKLRVICPATGATIYILSAENPDSIRGIFLDGCVVDEAALIRADVFNKVILPALGDKKGWCLFASTPRGVANWFYKIYHRTGADWKAWHFPTSSNPHLPPETAASMQAVMTEREYQEEILAEFLDDAGSVFRRITEAATVEFAADPKDHATHVKVAGVDWGRSHDFTVCTMLCVDCNRVVDWERFNKIDFSLQRERIKDMYAKWSPETIWVESNSIGRPNLEALVDDDIPVYGFEMTASSKPPLIQSLVLAIERHAIDIPRDYVAELQAYTSKINLNTGHPSFSAPQGDFDDRVISLALANRARVVAGGWGGVVGA